MSAGYRMPAEGERHQQTWMLWPQRPDNWRLGGKPAQAAFVQVARAIAEFEPVSVGVNADQYIQACHQLQHDNIRVLEISSDDAWVRDTGPTFVFDANQQLTGIDWRFNAWGGLQGGLYFPWQRDDEVARKLLQIEGCRRVRADDLVMEGGAFHVDGEGTLLTTEECLLNRNRNPHLSREQLEEKLGYYLGIERVIWLPQGVYADETDGHVDNFCCFVRPGEVLLAWCDDPEDPNFSRCRAAEAVLENSRDAAGRSFVIHRLPLPEPLYMTAEEAAGVDFAEGSQPRQAGDRLAGSYINFLLVNGGLILPGFACPQDQEAVAILSELFADRRVVQLPGREILLGGGNIHCITQQQPWVKNG
nr:agmatine deiminase [Marinospirillum perlucidum]